MTIIYFTVVTNSDYYFYHLFTAGVTFCFFQQLRNTKHNYVKKLVA